MQLNCDDESGPKSEAYLACGTMPEDTQAKLAAQVRQFRWASLSAVGQSEGIRLLNELIYPLGFLLRAV